MASRYRRRVVTARLPERPEVPATVSAAPAGSHGVSGLRACAAALLSIVALSRTVLADDIAHDDVPPGQLALRVYAGADGLRNLVINGIAQDRDGLLWIGTDDGVYRFDGERFTHFAVSEGLTSSLVLVVGVGPGGEACVGGTKGLVCWDGGRFSRAATRGLPEVPVHAMVTFAGVLWVRAGRARATSARCGRIAPGWWPETTRRCS
ncbi:MAG: hypothetical protein E6J91_19175 [Deltaproteobacteria bacterium]|nr:MAG: hypothetical protein E6J91_19175 [Deltaproteobacteria bacterium]